MSRKDDVLQGVWASSVGRECVVERVLTCTDGWSYDTWGTFCIKTLGRGVGIRVVNTAVLGKPGNTRPDDLIRGFLLKDSNIT